MPVILVAAFDILGVHRSSPGLEVAIAAISSELASGWGREIYKQSKMPLPGYQGEM